MRAQRVHTPIQAFQRLYLLMHAYMQNLKVYFQKLARAGGYLLPLKGKAEAVEYVRA